MVVNTKNKTIESAIELFANSGIEGSSMRKVAAEVGIAQSVIYHHFENQRDLLDEVFNYSRLTLGNKRKNLKECKNTKDLLQSRVEFQLDNAIYVVAILKYYMTFRKEFERNNMGFIPVNAYKHMIEVLEFGLKNNEIDPELDIKDTAKVMTHAVNGYVLEYFPDQINNDEKQELVNTISNFIYRSIKSKEVINDE